MLRFFVAFLIISTCECRFQDAYSKWSVENDCNEEFCLVGDDCQYEIQPFGQQKNFGAQITGLQLGSLTQACANQLIQDAIMFRFLVFSGQTTMTWQDEIHFTEKMGDGEAFPDSKSANRKFHPKVPDERLGYFSNDPNEGLMYQGTEGWHVDGNTVDLPHTFTIIHCIAANKHGPTLLVPLREIVASMTPEERSLLETITFVSGFNASIQHPLLYKHPIHHDDTIMLALGILSGQYLQTQPDGKTRVLSVEETQFIQDILETKILGSNLIYTHHWKAGDMLVLNNPSLAHIAGPGSQGSAEVTGLRLMHRSTVGGKVRPSKKTTAAVTPLKYHCYNHPPFQEREYCIFSLKNAVFYPRYGEFETKEQQRKICQNVHEKADMAVIPNQLWNNEASKIVSSFGVPHWINATNPEGKLITWEIPKWFEKDSSNWTFSDWHQPSGQPNDCILPETCVFIGPNGKWFDLTCGPKIVPNYVPKTPEDPQTADPGPVVVWEDGKKYSFNVYPLCGVFRADIPFEV